MADDLTKQEILFYTVILAEPDGITEDNILEGMGNLAEELGGPRYFDAVPRPLEERLKDGEDRDVIKLCRPLTWRISNATVRPYVLHLTERYLVRDEEQSARAILLEKLGSPSSASISKGLGFQGPTPLSA
ncbi:MAG: hypothetical protein R3D88_05870 [Alphaproteobacteria bacterium]|nr:hypothetical protein [Alphaproteobacteria bacterium]